MKAGITEAVGCEVVNCWSGNRRSVTTEIREADVITALEEAYRDCPFVRLTGDTLPEIKHVVHTNFCDIGWKIDTDSGRLILVACLDNLVKGAAGQALQNLNVAFGFDETIGLL